METTISVSKGQLPFSVPNDPANVALVRDVVMALLNHRCLSKEQRDDIKVLVGEAAANAAEHSDGSSDVECIACWESDSFQVQIINPSNGFFGEVPPCEDLDEEHGRGCKMIERIVSDLCSSGLRAQSKHDFNSEEGKTTFKFSLLWK